MAYRSDYRLKRDYCDSISDAFSLVFRLGLETEDMVIAREKIDADKTIGKIPQGELLGYKKCRFYRSKEEYESRRYSYKDNCIVTLKIPEDADVVAPVISRWYFNDNRDDVIEGKGLKHRCSKAIVISVEDMDGNPLDEDFIIASSYYDSSFIYEVGKTVVPETGFDSNESSECGKGIHFFRDKKSAIDY